MNIENQHVYRWSRQDFSPAMSAMHIHSDFELSDEDKEILVTALDLFGTWEQTHPVPGGSNRITLMILSETGRVTLLPEENLIGISYHQILIIWRKLRDLRSLPVHGTCFPQTNPLKMAIILEEMCHGLYMIRDEIEVKKLVLQILRLGYPDIQLHDLFPSIFPPSE